MLIRRSLPEVRVYYLLDSAVYLALSQNPGRITEEINEHTSINAIDE